MRLTLRTLLALRNKTLGPEDETTLTEKVRESSYAQQLLELISNVVSNTRLSALPPTATGPTDDPNVMAEYIDSTLPPEQAAEVDRTCLESPLHLAEAAGSHEVLTLVLGKPAEVSPELRDRIYGISSYAADTLEALRDASQDSVAPVSLNDSGAFQAASRMQPAAAASPQAVRAVKSRGGDPAIAGSRQLNAAEASEIFGDRMRTSRVVPWLVTLALVAVFLFVLKQAFGPLLQNPPAEVVQNNDVSDIERPEGAPEGLPANAPEPEPESEPGAPPEPERDLKPVPAPAVVVTDSMPPPAADVAPSDEPAAASDAADPRSEDADATKPVTPPMASEPEVRVAEASAETADSVPPESVTVKPAGAEPVVAKTASSNGLLLGLPTGGQEWFSVATEAELMAGTTLISPPKFRNQVTVTDRYELTLVGPTMVQLGVAHAAGELNLQGGRVVVTSLAAETKISVRFGERLTTVELPEVGTTLAIELTPFRAPGTDPRLAENRVLVTEALAVVGPVFWEVEGAVVEEIQTGQQWRQVGDGAAEKTTVESVPSWIDGGGESSIDRTARETLLTLLPIGQPVALALREATHFRRAEVAALAARTLIMLGHADVYFGTDGVLSDPDQKSYWQDHVAALKARLDHSPAAAKDVLADALTMDAANAQPLFRLLWDYSPEQLAAGDDAYLVETLDSPHTALRVLAIEDLRRITGTTLFFKPEQEVASRRRNDIKKWEARLNRKDIRWQTVPIAGANN